MTARSPHAVLPLALAAGAVVLTVAGCGASAGQTPSSTGPAGVSTPSTSSAPSTRSAPSTSAPATPATSSSPAGGAGASGSRCAVGDLRIRYAVDPGGGAAGSVMGTLTFTNTGSARCTLTGFPGVSFVGGGDGTQVGAPATRTDAAARTRTLGPGRSAEAALRRTQPGSYGDDCQPTLVDGFRVYPPDSTDSAFVAFKTTGCRSSSAPLLQVGPVG